MYYFWCPISNCLPNMLGVMPKSKSRKNVIPVQNILEDCSAFFHVIAHEVFGATELTSYFSYRPRFYASVARPKRRKNGTTQIKRTLRAKKNNLEYTPDIYNMLYSIMKSSCISCLINKQKLYMSSRMRIDEAANDWRKLDVYWGKLVPKTNWKKACVAGVDGGLTAWSSAGAWLSCTAWRSFFHVFLRAYNILPRFLSNYPFWTWTSETVLKSSACIKKVKRT